MTLRDGERVDMALVAVRWSDRDLMAWPAGAAALAVLAALALRIVGVPPIDVHGPLHYVGIMDPLCGGTRAAFLLLSGDPAAAARYNPLVFPLAALVVLVLLRAGIGTLTGRWLDVRPSRGARRTLLAVVALAVAALAVRQQLHAELLMQGWPPPGAV